LWARQHLALSVVLIGAETWPTVGPAGPGSVVS